jgi:probable rRNA maturation factor
MATLARCAIRHLCIHTPGTLAITFIGSRRMRTLNRRFYHRDRATDVLSFRYDGEPIVGEIVIAPSQARAYAKRHRIPYTEELSRYVIHGLLHWLGYEDRTLAQQRTMRGMEEQVLAQCRDTSTFRQPQPARRTIEASRYPKITAIRAR